jgi:hypothetical protein
MSKRNQELAGRLFISWDWRSETATAERHIVAWTVRTAHERILFIVYPHSRLQPKAIMSNTTPSTSTTAPVNRHALTAVEKQRTQLEKLLKDPAKPAYIPPPPKEKSIRPAREMMKNVQGSSAGAGSGEFHVYKASRRREYERLKLLEEASAKVSHDEGVVDHSWLIPVLM